MKLLKPAVSALCLLGAVAAQAEPLSYQNITVGYGEWEVDIGDKDVDFSGIALAGSMPLSDNIFLLGGYIDTDSDDEYAGDEISLTNYSLGAGFHAAIAANTDFVAALKLVRVKTDHLNDSETDSGRSLSIGVRSKPSAQFELAAGLTNSKVDDETDTTFSVSGSFFVSPNASIGIELSDGDDTSAQGVYVRFDF